MAVEGTVVCGCTGKRSCLLCEKKTTLKNNSDKLSEDKSIAFWYDYCTTCSRTFRKGTKCNHTDTDISEQKLLPTLDGIRVIGDFVNEEEESLIVAAIDKNEWKVSQSGRLKQVNFQFKHSSTVVFCNESKLCTYQC